MPGLQPARQDERPGGAFALRLPDEEHTAAADFHEPSGRKTARQAAGFTWDSATRRAYSRRHRATYLTLADRNLGNARNDRRRPAGSSTNADRERASNARYDAASACPC